MSFWKVLGGVAAGVGAVAALPVAGPIGAVTLVGAAVGAAIGGTTGAIVSSNDKEKNTKLKDDNRKLKSEMSIKDKKFIEQFEEQTKTLKDRNEYFDLLVSLFGIGMAAANADGDIASEEKEAIDTFVLGLGQANLPDDVKKQIENLRQNPPNLKTAIEIAKKGKNIDWKMYRYEIMLVLHADNEVNQKEKEFLAAFDQLIA